MSTCALDGASKYLNNLLLARGFLHDGKSINFVQLAANATNKVEDCDNTAITATVINLIHDLILRRDRDAEQRESLSSAIRELRAEESQHILDLQRVQDKNIKLQTELSASEAQQRNTLLTLKKTHNEVKELKEQVLKVKSTLDQVRAKAISDIRKRDIELDKLKNHLSGINRGKKEPTVKSKSSATNNQKSAGRSAFAGQGDGISKEWAVENEDHELLAALVNETTTENVALRKIVEDSLAYLKTLTGLDGQAQQQSPVPDLTSLDKAIGIPGQYRTKERELKDSIDSAESDTIVPVPSLATSMSQVLALCQTILRDPSFVPIEEVQIRDEEIAKLRAGWEKMADRWKEAVTMMSQWRQKTMSDGQEHFSIEGTHRQHDFEMEDFSNIPVFSRSIALRPDGRPVLDPIQEEELTSMLIDHHSRLGNHSLISTEHEITQTTHDETLPEPDQTGTPRQPNSQDQIHIHVDEEAESDLDLSERAAPQTIASPARRGITIQAPTPLANNNANAKKRKSPNTSLSPRKRRSSPSTTAANADNVEPVSARPLSTVNTPLSEEDTTDPLRLDTLTPNLSDNEDEDDVAEGDEVEDTQDLFALPSNSKPRSKLPRMTVAEKLAAMEAEASEATEVIRRRQATSYGPDDKRGKDRERSVKGKVTTGEREKKNDGTRGVEQSHGSKGRVGAGGKGRNSSRRTASAVAEAKEKGTVRGKDTTSDRVKKARDRRRSTLTPAELGSLMGR